MAEVEYRTVAGFVQFDPNERDYNGKTLIDALIQNVSGNFNIRVTIWPEQNVKVKKGDLLFANGKYTTREDKGRTYHNLDARNLKVFPGDAPTPKVVNSLDTADDEPAPF